jgi:hypothetical protein
MDTRRIVLISETQFVPLSELSKVSSAVQKQVNDHFGPAWDIQAAIDSLASLADIPPNSWPVVIRDNIGINEAGVHWNETGDKPFALVTFREGETLEEGWQPSVSHEEIVTGSAEYQDRLVTLVYRALLQRAASSTELSLGQSVLSQPALGPGQPSRDEQLKAGIVSLGEYFQRQGASNAGFVTSLYTLLLGRQPDSGGNLLPYS